MVGKFQKRGSRFKEKNLSTNFSKISYNPKLINNNNNLSNRFQNTKQNDVACTYCGQFHLKGKCPAYGKTCSYCGGLSHFAAACRRKGIRAITAQSQTRDDNDSRFCIELITKKCRNVKK